MTRLLPAACADTGCEYKGLARGSYAALRKAVPYRGCRLRSCQHCCQQHEQSARVCSHHSCLPGAMHLRKVPLFEHGVINTKTAAKLVCDRSFE